MAPTERRESDPADHEAGDAPAVKPTWAPETLDESYYRFGAYVSKTRMLTFWHQLDEVLASAPTSVLEIGIGPRVVAGTLRELGVAVTTMDVNESLRPDIVGSVTDLEALVGADAFDTVLCARVLHHLEFETFDHCLAQLAAVATERVVMTLPVDDLRLYVGVRRTAGNYRIFSLGLPSMLKSILERVGLGRGTDAGAQRYRMLWKIGSGSQTSEAQVRALVEARFRIVRWYQIPEDRSHAVLVLEPQ